MALKKRRLSAVEFDALNPFLSDMSANRLAAARAAMVDNRTLQSIANDYGWTRQAVSDAISFVWNYHQRYLASQLLRQSPSDDGSSPLSADSVVIKD